MPPARVSATLPAPAGHADAAVRKTAGRCYAVYDLGSNSIKTLIAEKKGRSFRVLHEISLATRLAEDLIQTGRLAPEAVRRTLDALKTLRATADASGATHRAAVATSAVRDSKNRKQFLKAAREVLGFPVRLLSGGEEAEAIFAGVAADPHWRGGNLFVIDVGGGSAEWIEGRGVKIARRMSLPLGCVRLRERFIQHFPVGGHHLRVILSTLHNQLQPALAGYRLEEHRLVATGGTATALAAIDLKLKEFDPAKIDHYRLSRRRLRTWMDRLAVMSLSELRELDGLPPKRIDLILAGACVLYVSMEILGADHLAISTRGLRYGILHHLLHGR
jgi:exopolyphosphatase / guanosine-5'-triphosphate,3'-diphosphate pyrophosphatase